MLVCFYFYFYVGSNFKASNLLNKYMTELKKVGFICLFYLSWKKTSDTLQKNTIVVAVKFGVGKKHREST